MQTYVTMVQQRKSLQVSENLSARNLLTNTHFVHVMIYSCWPSKHKINSGILIRRKSRIVISCHKQHALSFFRHKEEEEV